MAVTPPNLTGDDRADLARFLREGSRPTATRFKRILDKLEPPPPAPEPLPPPKPPGERSVVLSKRSAAGRFDAARRS